MKRIGILSALALMTICAVEPASALAPTAPNQSERKTQRDLERDGYSCEVAGGYRVCRKGDSTYVCYANRTYCDKTNAPLAGYQPRVPDGVVVGPGDFGGQTFSIRDDLFGTPESARESIVQGTRESRRTRACRPGYSRVRVRNSRRDRTSFSYVCRPARQSTRSRTRDYRRR